MNTRYYFMAAFACLTLTLHSCVVLSPKKYKALLSQRDWLDKRSADLENTSFQQQDSIKYLKGQVADGLNKYNTLNSDNNALNDKYNALNTDYTALNEKYGTLKG